VPEPGASGIDARIALVIEDEPDLRDQLVECLRGLGLIVVPAADRDCASVIARKVRPDLIVVDAPADVGAVIHVSDFKRRGPDASIVVLSSVSLPEKQEDFRAAGADAVLQKPVAIPHLGAVISRLLWRRRLRRVRAHRRRPDASGSGASWHGD
jgi:DNA-binding response OmpR family regulator